MEEDDHEASERHKNDEAPTQIIDDFEILEIIGKGGFSHVHVARHIPTGCYCAAKIIPLSSLREQEFIGIMREVSVFMQVDHPNICNLYSMSVNDDNLVFFMEYASRGTLLDYVNGKGGLTEFESQRYFIQIYTVLRHLHIYHFLVHRDLKLENILIDSKGNMKLTDFGLAGTYYNNILRTFVGTAGYQPPEILAGNQYDEKCDVWSLGVCLYAMITGRLPFSTQNVSYRALVQEVQDMIFPQNFSPQLVDLLRKMFEINPGQRPSLIQLQSHPWLRGVPQLGTNIAPQPIIFYKVPNVAVIKKFKRKSVKPDQKVLDECEQKGADIQKLKEDLANGLNTKETAIYFCLLRPLLEKPEKQQIMKPKPPPIPIIPGSRPKRPTGMSMPGGHEVRKLELSVRKSSVPLFSQTSKNGPIVVSPNRHSIRIASNRSNYLTASTNKLLTKPHTPQTPKRKL